MTFFTSIFLIYLVYSNPINGEKGSHELALIQWLRRKGGVFSPKLEIRKTDYSYGMFAKENISEKELLIGIPSNVKLTAERKVFEKDAMTCDTVYNLIREMRLGNDSYYAPYVNYLLSQPTGQLPSAWSNAGQNLLLSVLNGDVILPPKDPFVWSKVWKNHCQGSDDPFEENAAFIIIQRAWDDVMVPVFDFMSHRNGKFRNTESNSVFEERIKIRASRSIRAGEEIYTSYDECEDCGGRANNYGTPEMLRDYGFVEDYPQKWFFHEQNTGFEIDFIYDDEGETNGDVEISRWIWDKPDESNVNILQNELDRLAEMRKTHFEIRDENVPSHEWDNVRKYHYHLSKAMALAITDVMGDDSACVEKGYCKVEAGRYRSLQVEPAEIPSNEYRSCDQSLTMNFRGFDVLEDVDTLYQEFSFFRNPVNSDTCFDIDDIVQICTSYRPHYHEGSVHFPARFTPNIERVLFVGGGDSMLLHEALKYPSLKKVVGLELDQTITRKCFKHFGSQPHWDNEKVEWWFGDATKSLLMLPKEYFGSFDMILVDLSETVMSFGVTDKLDIMEALSLLLKEDGIFVKNEHYLGKLSSIFKYTAQVHWYDNPVICSQAMIMGSNTIDFMKTDVTDHKVSTLWLEPHKSVEDSFDMIHDYVTNNTSLKLCKEDKPEIEPTIQERSPGILMILEAENANADLKDSEKMKNSIMEALVTQGVTGYSSFHRKSIGDNYFTEIFFEEGYVISRTWPKEKYCAFDIHLWSNFDKQENIKKALLAAVDSKYESSYRIVAGGMFGARNWKDDKKNNGPRYTRSCDENEESTHKVQVEGTVKNIVLGEAMKAFNNEISAIVLCGFQSQSCSSLESLQINENVTKVLSLWTCPTLDGVNEYSENYLEVMYACEKDVINKMLHAAEVGKFNSIVVDPSVSYAFASAFFFNFQIENNAKSILLPKANVFSLNTHDSESWRNNLIKRFYTNFHFEPTFRSEILFGSNFELQIVSTGDWQFNKNLRKFMRNAERLTDLTFNVNEIYGGMWIYYEDGFQPTRVWLPEDYDRAPPLEQWKSQQPLGMQTIFQFEKSVGKLTKVSIKNALNTTLYSGNFITGEPSSDDILIFDNLGDGCLFAAFWSEGNVNVLWDGKTHLDINLFTYEESDDHANFFEFSFMKKISNLKTILRDEQPRGTGRVVSWLEDIEPRHDPHWMFTGEVPSLRRL